MKQLIDWGGHVAALTGLLVCTFVGFSSLSGRSNFSGYDLETVFLVGLGGLILACLSRLYCISWGTGEPLNKR